MSTADTPRSPPDLGLIGTADAAALLGVTEEWVRRLTVDGWLKKQARGTYRVVDVVQGYVASLKDESRHTSKSASASRVQDVRAEEIQMRMDEKRGKALAAGQAEAVFVIDAFFSALKSDLLAVPARVTSDLAVRRKIEDGVLEAFADAGKRAGDAAGRVETTGKDWRVAASAKSRRVGKEKPKVPVKRRRARAA